jgi:hypothetical protein
MSRRLLQSYEKWQRNHIFNSSYSSNFFTDTQQYYGRWYKKFQGLYSCRYMAWMSISNPSHKTTPRTRTANPFQTHVAYEVSFYLPIHDPCSEFPTALLWRIPSQRKVRSKHCYRISF